MRKLLLYDQGLEHGPRDFFANPAAGDPSYILRLAVEGGFNAVVLHVGTAEMFFADFAGEVPLVLKLNGSTELAPADAPLSPLTASVRDAVRLGADAVGYTLYCPGAVFRGAKADDETVHPGPVRPWTPVRRA